MLDSRGTPITEGDIIAYNLSGQTALGRVLKAGEGNSPYRRNIKVRLAFNCAGMPEGHISTVRNQTSVLVLKEDDLDAC